MGNVFRALLRFVALVALALSGLVAILCGCSIAALVFAWWQEGRLQRRDVEILTGSAMILLPSAALAVGLWLASRRLRRPGVASSASPTASSRSQRRSKIAGKFGDVFWAIVFTVCLWERSAIESPLLRGGLSVLCLVGIGAALYGRILLHELGHLAGARLAGMQLLKVRVGSGPRLARCRSAGGLIWDWRLLPGSGMAVAADRCRRRLKQRHFAFVLGGPAADGLLVCALYLGAIRPFGGFDATFSHGLVGFSIFSVFAIVTLSAAASLVPHNVMIEGRAMRSDGALLFRIPFLKEDEVSALLLQSSLDRINAALEGDAPADAEAILREMHLTHPTEPRALAVAEGWIRKHERDFAGAAASFGRALDAEPAPTEAHAALVSEIAACRALAGDPESALQICDETLAAAPEDARVTFLDAFACIPVVQHCPTMLPYAERCAAQALKIAPEMLTLVGTYGALLVEQGRFSEGEPFLRRLLRESNSPRDRGIASYFMARLSAQTAARARESRRFRARAALLCPERWLLARLRAQLGATAEAFKDARLVDGAPVHRS